MSSILSCLAVDSLCSAPSISCKSFEVKNGVLREFDKRFTEREEVSSAQGNGGGRMRSVVRLRPCHGQGRNRRL